MDGDTEVHSLFYPFFIIILTIEWAIALCIIPKCKLKIIRNFFFSIKGSANNAYPRNLITINLHDTMTWILYGVVQLLHNFTQLVEIGNKKLSLRPSHKIPGGQFSHKNKLTSSCEASTNPCQLHHLSSSILRPRFSWNLFHAKTRL